MSFDLVVVSRSFATPGSLHSFPLTLYLYVETDRTLLPPTFSSTRPSPVPQPTSNRATRNKVLPLLLLDVDLVLLLRTEGDDLSLEEVELRSLGVRARRK